MKSKKLTIQINKPHEEVFSFVLNPQNSPKWIDSFVTEKTNELPAKLGTIYKNCDENGNWSQYSITKFIENKEFILTKNDNNYQVKYTFMPIGKKTKIEYHEWVDRGELSEPFNLKTLQNLKAVLES